MKKDLLRFSFDDLYSKPPGKNFETNKIKYKNIDEIWGIDLADMIDYKNSNNKGYRYIFIIIHNFSKHLWAIPLKNKYSQSITNDFSNILTSSARSADKIESDRGKERCNYVSQKFLKGKNRHRYSRSTDKCPKIVERVIRTIRNLLGKPIFRKVMLIC